MPNVSQPDPSLILYEEDERSSISRITLNRPRVLNAINTSLLGALVQALSTVQKSNAKVCVLAASGSSFCSGEDLKETLAPKSDGRNATELRTSLQQLQEVTRLMTRSKTVFISAVQGWAVGGGAEIALAADIVVAEPTTIFKFPEVLHAQAPTGGITGRLSHIIGLHEAKRVLLLGEDIPAPRASALRLVTEICDDSLVRALELGRQIAQRSSRSISMIKRTIESVVFHNLDQLLDSEMDAASWCFADERSLEVFEKFRSKGKPECFGVTEGADLKGQYSTTNLVDALKRTSLEVPSKPFLRFGTAEISYGQFLTEVQHQADGLIEAGLRPGDVVAAMMVNSKEMARLWFASMWIGALWAPLHTEFRGLTLENALALVSPKIMIIDDTFLDCLPHTFSDSSRLFVNGDGVPDHPHAPLKELMGSKEPNPACITPATISSLLFTSGTTGPSKACALSHNYFISTARSLIEPLALRRDDILFCPFPLCHADATSLTVIPALLLGATAAISRRFSASRWWDEIRETRSTVADFMGATLSILHKAPHSSSDSNNPLRMMWGVPVPSWVEDFEKRFDLKVYEVYGSTETGLPVVQRIDRPRVEGSCGVPLRNVGLRIVDEEGNDVNRGNTGELLVFRSQDERFTCYYRNEEATRKAIQHGWFHTGDYCRLDENDNLYFIGRKKHVIRRRGENISAFEVEESLLKHPEIRECAAFGVPSQLTEEDLKVSIVRSPGSQLAEVEVRDFAARTMSRFQVPRYVEFVDELPRTPTGKLEVFKLQDAWAQGLRATTKDFEGEKNRNNST